MTMSRMNYCRSLSLIIITAASMICGKSRAAVDPLLTQYYETPSIYNPAAAGSADAVRLRMAGRLQWVGMDDNPRIFSGVADMPLRVAGKTIGLGVSASRVSEGPFRSVSANLQAGYRFAVSGGSLSAAINLGYGHETYTGDYTTDEDNDESTASLTTRKLKGNRLDIGAGLFYVRPRFWAGVSVMHINAPDVVLGEHADYSSEYQDGSMDEIRVKYRRTAYLMSGGNIPLGSTLLEMMPSVIVKSDFDRVRGELTARVRYKKLLTCGVGYRLKDAVTATLAVDYKGFFVGYSFDYPIDSWSRQANGSHEIVAGYSFKLDLTPTQKKKYKSIRIM